MKRRMIALAVSLCLLLSALMPTAISGAEELPPMNAAETMDSPVAATDDAEVADEAEQFAEAPDEAPLEPSALQPPAEEAARTEPDEAQPAADEVKRPANDEAEQPSSGPSADEADRPDEAQPSTDKAEQNPGEQPADESAQPPEDQAQPDPDEAEQPSPDESPEGSHPLVDWPQGDTEAEADETEAEPHPLVDWSQGEAEAGEIGENSLTEPADVALGSDGVQYAGVAYLSRAAFESMDEASQASYIDMVDDLTGLLDRGIPVYTPVFSLDADGTLAFDCKFEIEPCSEDRAAPEIIARQDVEAAPADAPDSTQITAEADGEAGKFSQSSPEATGDALDQIAVESDGIFANPDQASAEAAGDALDQTATEPDGGISAYSEQADPDLISTEPDGISANPEQADPEQADPEQSSAEVDGGDASDQPSPESTSPAPIAENVELAEQIRRPIARVEGRLPVSRGASLSGGKANSKSLYWDGGEYFYSQLSAAAKVHFKAGERDIIANFLNGYTAYVPSGQTGTSCVYDALNALMMTYPAGFDWTTAVSTVRMSSRYAGGQYQYTVVFDISPHYSASLEQQARSKVNSLVSGALSFAKSKYPNDLDYGMMYYFDDWLCANNYYNYTGTDDAQQNSAAYYYCHSSYGTLLKGYGVCESYALALSRLMDAAGIPNMYAVGDAYKANGSYAGRHAWNYVHMSNGKYYLQDTTWDDPASNSQKSYRTYLLRANDSRHVPDGVHYSSKKFRFPAISTAKYSPRTAAANPTPRMTLTPKPTVTPTPTPTPPPTPTVRPNTPTPRPCTPPPTMPPTVPPTPTPTPTPTLRPNTPTPAPNTPTPTPDLGGESGIISSSLYLAKGESKTLSVYDFFLLGAPQSWSSSNAKIAKVSQSGKVTGVAPGKATIRLDIGGHTAYCAVYVYQITGITFDANGKSAMTVSGNDRSFTLRIHQKNPTISADALLFHTMLGGVQVSSSKPDVARGSAWISGDSIHLTVTPGESGDAVLKIKFGGKTAKLTYKLRSPIRDEWFSLSGLSGGTATYSGKAIKPKVSLSWDAPGNVKYDVKYLNNRNAGVATVRITGKGYYGGVVEKRFRIEPAYASGKLSISGPKAKVYNGSPQSAGVTVKLGGKKLKAGVDYRLLYDGSPDAPVNAGSYRVTIQGINYAGTLSDGRSHSFTIKPVPITKLKISLAKSSVKYSGRPVTADQLGMKLKYGSKALPRSDYELYYVYGGRWMDPTPPTSRGSYYVLAAPITRNITTSSQSNCIIKSFKIKAG